MQALADHESYRITLHRIGSDAAPGDPLVITFGGQPSDLADSGFGTGYCKAMGWDSIHVAQRHGTQFQGLSLDQFRDAVLPVCAGRDVVSYGSSLGGYAALYFGGVIDARIVAAAPMLPAWPRLRNKSYADLVLTHPELAEAPRATRPPICIFDPMLVPDSLIIEQMVLPAYPAARLVRVPHGGHTVLVTLSRERLLKPLITAMIAQDRVIDFDAPGEGTATWHAERGRLLARSDPDQAIIELERSLAIVPTTQPFCVLINILIRRGDHAGAQRRLDAARASGHKRLKLVPSLRKTAIAAGLRVE